MYAFLLKRLPAPLVNLIVIAVQTAAIVAIVLLADKPFSAFAYMRL